MKKLVLRLLALVLVLCMVVPCMPVGALATELTRPENISDAEWEVLRQQLLAQLAEEQAAATPPVTAETLPETDSLSKSETGNLMVTDKAEVPADAPDKVKDQTVSVELPAKADTIVEETVPVGTGTDTKEIITNEYETTIKVEGKDTVVKVEESYDLNADITAVDTDTEGKVTDITYEISLDAAVSAEEAKPASGTDPKEVVKSDVVDDVDIAANQAVEEANKDPKTDIPEPQYKVDMSVNGMNTEEITRVEHKYTTPKGDGSEGEEEHVEYYYNAKNGTEDTTKKYFTVSIVEKVKEGTEKVKETVVSLWTGFLGIFHITTDAFEGAEKTDGTKDTYSNLSDAATANDGKTVEMLRDYETANGAAISNDVTVDLNGHKYTNTSENAAIDVSGDGDKVTLHDGAVISNGDGVVVSGNSNKFSLKNIFLRSDADNDSTGDTAAVQVTGSGNTVSLEKSGIDGTRSSYGVQDASTGKNTFVFDRSVVEGRTGVSLKNSDAFILGSRLTGTSGAALAVEDNTKANANKVVITGGRFESGKDVANIESDKGSVETITITGGRFTKSTDLYDYAASGYAVISHNDGSYFLYEVVGTGYTPTRDGYYFKGYRDANGNPISLKEAAKKGIIAYARWEEIPETETKQVPLITVKTDEKGCTTKVIFKGDTAFVTVKDAKGEFAPISEVVIPSIKRLQNKKIDTVEIQVDEDVSLVLDIEKAKENGFTDIVEVMLEKDMLLITSGQDTCIELDIAELKEADKPVTIQLVEGELTIMLGKNSSMTVDLTKALKTKERIVVKLESGVLKLYDKYHKPIKE